MDQRETNGTRYIELNLHRVNFKNYIASVYYISIKLSFGGWIFRKKFTQSRAIAFSNLEILVTGYFLQIKKDVFDWKLIRVGSLSSF